MVVVAAATNAVWTRVRLADAVYDLDDVSCELCGLAPDTLHHRLWWCSNQDVQRARNNACCSEIIIAARDSGTATALYQTALFPHPAEDCPLPAETPNVVFERGSFRSSDAQAMHGLLFADGLASTQHSSRPLPPPYFPTSRCGTINLRATSAHTLRPASSDDPIDEATPRSTNLTTE